MQPQLHVLNLTKKFNDFMAVDDVSFDAHGGEIVGLLGPNGAGKTTTLRMIATIIMPTSGTVEVCGHDILKESEEARSCLGMLTTDVGVYDRLSGRENLQYFGELYGMDDDRLQRRIEELIGLLEMQEFADKRAGKYSTGMKQKLAIARSVIHDPDVIIFDEPTSGLDVLASQTVLNFMRKARELGKCVVLSTHQMPDAERLCDRVVIIHEGRVVCTDTIDAIKSSTNTTSLEDAFLALAPKRQEQAENGSETPKQRVLPQWMRSRGLMQVLVIGFVGLYFLFRLLPALERFSNVSIVFLIIGIVLGLLDKYILRKRR